jgi:hypothetical protein
MGLKRRARRVVFAAWLVAALAWGCSAEYQAGRTGGLEGEPQEAPATETYTIEIFASAAERLYLITDASDGTRAAVRVAEGAAARIEPAEARALLAERQGVVGEAPRETVALSLPGFSLRVEANASDFSGESARIMLDVAGQQVEVNAADAASGPSGEALVRLAGVSAEETREFIVAEDGIDPGVQQQLLDELGL